jgi:phytol kinase
MVRFFELLKDRKIVDQTLSRKLVHTLAGPLFVLSWALYSSDPSARFLAMIAPALNGIRLILIGNGIIQSDKTVKAMSRTGDPRELLRGPLYYVVVLLAVTLFYWRESPTGLLVVSVMCGGDGLADIVGRNFGKSNPLSWNPAKSWAGTLAMTAGGWGMSMGLIIFFSRVLGFFEVQDIGAMTLGVSAICVAAAAIESLPINKSVDDNLSVPGVAAVMGSMLLQITAMLAI